MNKNSMDKQDDLSNWSPPRYTSTYNNQVSKTKANHIE